MTKLIESENIHGSSISSKSQDRRQDGMNDKYRGKGGGGAEENGTDEQVDCEARDMGGIGRDSG